MLRIFLKNIIAVSTFDSIDLVQLTMISITSFKIMEPGELECPWSAGGIDLCLVELSSSEKLWLANQIVLKLQTTRELANLYNLKMDSLRQYGRHLRGHKPMLKCGGRPVAIDATGLEELSETLQVNPNMARELLHAEINQKRLPTVMRRFNYAVPAVTVKELSRRSLRRYETRLEL